MKKIIFILLGVVLTTGAMAQTTEKKVQIDKRKDEKELKNEIAAKKDEKKEVGNDLTHLKIGAAVKDRKEVRADRRRIHRKARHIKKYHGVEHPIIKAQKQLKEDKEKKENN